MVSSFYQIVHAANRQQMTLSFLNMYSRSRGIVDFFFGVHWAFSSTTASPNRSAEMGYIVQIGRKLKALILEAEIQHPQSMKLPCPQRPSSGLQKWRRKPPQEAPTD